jgi:NAD+ synthase (glutamine-hydrolysing)
MKIALAQINPVIGDFAHNTGRMAAYAEQAVERSCDLVVFPELAVSGYPPRDLLEKKDFIDANLHWLQRLVERVRGIGVICGFIDVNPSDAGKPLFNAAALFENGRILKRVNKRLLPTYDVFDESRYFEPGTDCRATPYKGRHLGLTICEDAWNDKDIFQRRIYHLDPVGLMVADGADVIVNISASPFHMGKIAFRKKMHATIAAKYKVPLVYVNQVGGNDSLLFDGISAACDADGQTVARALDFAEDMVVFDAAASSGEVHPNVESDTEAVLKALVMGTRDYVHKCGFSKAVVGLSGGIDSALTLTVAARALGRENVAAVFMPSPYTSRENFEDTRLLADHLGVSLEIIAIDAMFQTFLEHFSPGGAGGDPGITEQNIQARIRGTLLMAISNQRGCLLLSTGNKSETAVGYCTLYGDMSGGLAVISDVPKTMVYELSRFLNREKEVIPRRILTKAPTAELKPGQTDQDDLPPYEVLDPILKGYIEEGKSIAELAAMGYDRELVRSIVTRVDRNEYKRQQAAPGLKVTSKAFGYGRRYPIAQRYNPS